MTVKEIAKKEPESLIGHAYAFAEKAHAGQKRKSGEPYFNHSLATAEILQSWHLDDATIAAGILHDTVEDTGVPLETIKKEFGAEVASLVDGVTKLGHIKYRETPADSNGAAPIKKGTVKQVAEENRAENLRKMVLALSQDLRVVFIKLADRLHNMQTLSSLPPVKQKRIALETDEVYASLAYRLGMHNVSGELQDLAFPYLHPREYEWLMRTAKERYAERFAYLEKIKPQVKKVLEDHDIKPLDIEIRAKRYSSLYKKLLKRDMDIERVHDLVAMRIIVETLPECYAALGVIHEAWPPLPRRIKDYIAMPKPNAYRSLHTTVIGPEGKRVEIQIRTKAMHDENEYGVAAHWLYKQNKQGVAVSGKKLAQEIAWVQQLKNWQEHFAGNADDPEEFVRAMKIDFFTDRIFAVTPRGDVIDLPVGSTPIDFAYHIHSEVGNAATGVKVNGVMSTLDHLLKSGDVVEIIMQKGKKPSEDWLRFAKTTIARDHIRMALRKKNTFAHSLSLPTHAELKVTAESRVGIDKDISGTIAEMHVGIIHFHAEPAKGKRSHVNRVEIQSTDKKKIEKLIAKLRGVKGVKEVSYRLV
ncbi:MAG TPA: RelA/SpoT family protein [Candidatus Paceibacterota bacterium]|nr:RelA/SpoT family protein [Candidatus Paceibacterota bacterium]